jgi:hypothetical protein
VTPEQWDIHWHRIREQALTEGAQPVEAEAIADTETAEEFGTRPQEEGA